MDKVVKGYETERWVEGQHSVAHKRPEGYYLFYNQVLGLFHFAVIDELFKTINQRYPKRRHGKRLWKNRQPKKLLLLPRAQD